MRHPTRQVIKIEDINIKDIAKIEATTQSVMITLYNGDYINIFKKLEDIINLKK